jgi:hypothetical protein
MPSTVSRIILVGPSLVLVCVFARGAAAQENLLANPGLEKLTNQGFFAGWGQGGMGRVNKTLFVADDGHDEPGPDRSHATDCRERA